MQDHLSRIGCVGAALVLCAVAWAEPQEWRINIQDGGLHEFVQQVAEITSKDIVVDPRVRQANNVTVISNTPLGRDGVFELFLSVLRVHGYSLSRAGDVYTVVQNTVGKQIGGRIDSAGAAPDEIVTEVIGVNHILATDVVKTLRPLIPQYAHIAAVESANVVIISDHAHNIRRLLTIIEQTDLPGTEIITVVPLEHAWAGTVARLLQELAPGSLGAAAQGPTSVQIVANEGNNTLVLRGKEEPLRRIEAIVRQLDQPDTATGGTQVIRLDHADATEVAEMLNAMASSSPGASDQPPPSVHAYESLNAVVARGDPSFINDLRGIISQLDAPRGQVLI
ncbi:MAG: type II secretion system protein GspD, partial [Gammaproteobacteria bacterium]|nr:type II secretion system protein GspD [Gammaproteobacteria bacterium]